MINLFNFATGDMSLGYLANIFGNMGGVIPSTAVQNTPASGNVGLLGTMFMTFNGIILTVGALMLIYTTVVGVMITAHEGEFMGKNFHKIWTPIRTVLGIALLVPMGSGYSGIQLLMMWVIVQGVGAADSIWNTALQYIYLTGSPYAQISTPSIGPSQTMQQLFKALVCDATARVNQAAPDSINNGTYFCGGALGNTHPSKDSFCTTNVAPFNPNSASATYTLGPAGNCGTLTTCAPCTDPSQLACAACAAQNSALASIIPTLAGIAQKFAQLDYQYRDFYANSYNTRNKDSWQWIYSYCQAQPKPISKEECCVRSKTFPLSNTCKATTNIFPPPQSSATGVSGGQSPDDDAVNRIYLPYGIAPLYGANFMQTAVNFYMNQTGTAVAAFIAAQAQGSNTMSNNQALTTAKDQGWIVAGSYYYVIAQVNNANAQSAQASFSMDTRDVSQTTMNSYRNNVSAAATLLNSTTSSTPSGKAMNQMGGWGGALGSATSSSQLSVSMLSGSNSNPVIQMQQTGFALLLIVQAIFLYALVATIAVGLASGINLWVEGTGGFNPESIGSLLFYMILVPAVFAMLALMITYGGLLGVYIPLIPYIIFTLGAIGWFISAIEAMVAGPLVALGILSPAGHHELLGKAEPALTMLFSIFLRPSLMIFGLMAGILLSAVVGSMINTAFWGPVAAGIASGGINSGVQNNTTTGGVAMAGNPLEFFIFLGAYVAIIMAAMNKCFSTIHLLPDRVMGWISGQTAGAYGGEEAFVGEMKGGVSGVGSKVGGGAEGLQHAPEKMKYEMKGGPKKGTDKGDAAKGKFTENK